MVTGTSKTRRIFLLSPAYAGGERARLVLNERATFDLARRIKKGGAPLGEVFAFISGLYFRGKLAYARAFALAPQGIPGALVITPGRGLLPAEYPLTLDELKAIAGVPIHSSDPRYRDPLLRDARIIACMSGHSCEFVLLGSVATAKYLEPLLEVFGKRLLFPFDFVGRGDMSRGGLMLRCARQNIELEYIPVIGATLHGKRPPRLPKL